MAKGRAIAYGTAAAREPGLASHPGPTGFARGERVRVILDCDWGDLQHALDMVIDAKPAFDRQGRIGWGWHWSRRGKPGLFVRRTKRGYSATAANALQSGAKGEE